MKPIIKVHDDGKQKTNSVEAYIVHELNTIPFTGACFGSITIDLHAFGDTVDEAVDNFVKAWNQMMECYKPTSEIRDRDQFDHILVDWKGDCKIVAQK